MRAFEQILSIKSDNHILAFIVKVMNLLSIIKVIKEREGNVCISK